VDGSYMNSIYANTIKDKMIKGFNLLLA
jgi:hypothetical protein